MNEASTPAIDTKFQANKEYMAPTNLACPIYLVGSSLNPPISFLSLSFLLYFSRNQCLFPFFFFFLISSMS